MNLVPTRAQQPADDLDGLLRAFYRKEMPRRWPMPPVRPLPLRRDKPRNFASFRSHLALAASLALLLLGALLAGGGKYNSVAPPGLRLPGDGDAKRVVPFKEVGPEKLKSSLSLEQDPEGGTAIKVDYFEEVPPPK
jgi:hypothetical protein